MRTPLIPATLPGSRTRAEQFDQAVLEAAAELADRWPRELAAIEFAVDEVPPLLPADVEPGPEVVLDGPIPLSRFTPPGIDARGRATKARIVVYRRPLEARSEVGDELMELVVEVLVQQISAVLGEPDE